MRSKYRLKLKTEQKGVKGGVSHQCIHTHTHTAAAFNFSIPSSFWHVQHRLDMFSKKATTANPIHLSDDYVRQTASLLTAFQL